MNAHRPEDHSSPHADGTSKRPARAPYMAPRLENLGEIRELTLGGSPGAGDSGSPTAKRTKM